MMSNAAEEPEAGKPPAASRTAAGLPKRVPFAGPHPGDHGIGATPPPRASSASMSAPFVPAAGQEPQLRIPTLPHPGPTGIDPSGGAAPERVDPPGRRSRRAWLLPAGLAVALLVAGFVWWYDHGSAAKQQGPAGAVTDQTGAAVLAQGTTTPDAPPDSSAPPAQSAAVPPPSATTHPSPTTAQPTPAASVNSTGRDLALHRPAQASGSEGAVWGPANAVDGVADSRWSSAFSDPQWLVVDLGARWQVSRVAIHWEFAYGTAYRIDFSTDGTAWRTVFSTTQGKGGDVTIATKGAPARYVRLYGTHRSSQYGYSVYELEVH